jgi:hypothetical protein
VFEYAVSIETVHPLTDGVVHPLTRVGHRLAVAHYVGDGNTAQQVRRANGEVVDVAALAAFRRTRVEAGSDAARHHIVVVVADTTPELGTLDSSHVGRRAARENP